MDFCFLRARTSGLAASALALLLTVMVDSPAAMGQAAPATAGQAAPATKNYKDRGEYDLYSKVTQTADPKARLQVLNEWQDKYPQTDFQQERAQLYVQTLSQLATSDPDARKQLVDKGGALLKMDPNNVLAAYYLSLWGPAVGGASPAPDVQAQVDTAAHVLLSVADANFSPDKKPKNMTDDQWAQTKNAAIAIAHNALAWEALAKKDNATTEAEYKASLQANPTDSRVAAAYGKLLIDERKYPEGLYEYARAASYSGTPGSLPQAQRDQLLAYFNNAYASFHGSAEGAAQILEQSKTAALPPDGFKIVSANDLEKEKVDGLNNRIQNDPAFKIWYAIKQNLQDKGDAFFASDVKEFEIPGGGEGAGPKTFNGTVISLDPPDAPTKIVLGVEDPASPDATLIFSQPLPADALNTVKVGQKIDFSGIADSYVKDPYMLTFKDPTIPGVKTAAPAKTGKARRHR